MNESTPEVLAKAQHRFFHDPEFHAVVMEAVQLLADDLHANTGQRMNGDDRSLAALAAATALVISARRQAEGP